MSFNRPGQEQKSWGNCRERRSPASLEKMIFAGVPHYRIP
jgi:hypothetical protein